MTSIIVDYDQFKSIGKKLFSTINPAESYTAYLQILAKSVGFSSLQAINSSEPIYMSFDNVDWQYPHQKPDLDELDDYFLYHVVHPDHCLYIKIIENIVFSHPEIFPCGYSVEPHYYQITSAPYDDGLVVKKSTWRRLVKNIESVIEDEENHTEEEIEDLIAEAWSSINDEESPFWLNAVEYLHHYEFDFSQINYQTSDNELKQMVAQFIGKSVIFPDKNLIKNCSITERDILFENQNTDHYYCEPEDLLSELQTIRENFQL
jgi:hypothetical protein